jgi:hypothetical protein
VVAFIAGLLASLIINDISRLLNVWDSSLGPQVVALVIFVISGWLLEYTAPMNTKFKDRIKHIGIFCFALAPGVFIDAMIDFYFRHYDRNLFPFEIIMWWVFAPLPLLAGMTIGRGFFQFRGMNDKGSKPT